MIFKELDSVTLSTGRHYTTPDGKKYPSITTVLSKTSDKSLLEAWKARVGPAEADRISNEACINGTAMHELIEQYLLGKTPDHGGVNNVVSLMANNGYKLVDKYISAVVQCEAPLYSNKLKVAGRCDLVCFWNNQLAIADWKNKGTNDIPNEPSRDYLLQISFYAQSVYEITGRKPKVGVVATCNTFGSKVYTFDPFAPDITSELQRRIDTYYEENT